jgi:hypothetical protein
LVAVAVTVHVTAIVRFAAALLGCAQVLAQFNPLHPTSLHVDANADYLSRKERTA